MIIQRCGSFQGYKDVKVVYIKRLFFLISIQEERKKNRSSSGLIVGNFGWSHTNICKIMLYYFNNYICQILNNLYCKNVNLTVKMYNEVLLIIRFLINGINFCVLNVIHRTFNLKIKLTKFNQSTCLVINHRYNLSVENPLKRNTSKIWCKNKSKKEGNIRKDPHVKR